MRFSSNRIVIKLILLSNLVVIPAASKETGRLSPLNTIKDTMSMLQNEVETHWKTYTNLKEDYNKLLILGITDPTQLLKNLNLTITLPTPKSEVKGNSTEKNQKSSEEDDEQKFGSYEIIRPHHRQGLPAAETPLTSFGWAFALFGGFITIPFLIANLVMAIISFAINTSLRVDSPRLTALRQEQLDALATFGGVPLEIVNPNDDEDEAAAARWDTENSSGAESAEKSKEYQLIKPGKGLRCKTSLRSISSNNEFLLSDALGSMSNLLSSSTSKEHCIMFIGFLLFWIAGAGVIEYLGVDAALTLGLAIIALILLRSSNGESQDFGSNFVQKRISSGIGNSCNQMEELNFDVHRAIEKVYE